MKLLHREGFWYSKYYKYLPKPVPREKPWKGKKEFLKALQMIGELAKIKYYKGWSNCRICGCKNGSTECEFNGWVWPSGLKHYIEEHNVRPSLAFQEFVLGKYLDEH